MNPSSLDWSIQSALSSLFPPFEATAPTVLSQLFRTIEERYHGDALQCLLNFLIPAKHILESVQQAACAAYSDVLFQCEGWPLCLRDRVVIQLASINPLLLRPGDFYLQVEPFGEQSARIVLKSLLVQEDLLGQENLVLQAGCRVLECPSIEETPIPETSYPSIFTESWLREINEGRHGNPLCQCVLSSDKGVVKVPWTEVANPEFLDRPKSNIWTETKPCSTATIRVRDLNAEISEIESQVVVDFLPLEMETRIVPAIDGMALSVQLVESGSRLVKVDQGHTISSFAGKPVGWVSPNTWDSRQTQELEGEYVDLLEFNKEKETLVPHKIAMPMKPLGFKLVRTAQPSSKCNASICSEDCNPNKQSSEITKHDPDSKCRYRQSYMAALRNPVNFERASMLPCLDETRTDAGETEPSCEGYGVGLRLQPSSCMFGQTPNQADRNPMQSFENSAQQKQSPKNSTQPSQNVPHDRKSRENAESLDQHMTHLITGMVQARHPHKSFLTGQQDLSQTVLGTKAVPDKRHHCLNNAIRQDSFHMRISGQKHAKTQHLPKMGLRALPDHGGHRQDANLCLQGFTPIQHSQNQPTHITEQTPPLFQPQISQNPFKNENRLLDYNVFCDDRHCGRGPGSPVQVIKGKSRSKSRSSSSVSETAKQCLQSNKPTNRSHSDVFPEIIPMLPAIQGIKHTANLVSPKLNRPQEARKVSLSGKAGAPVVNGVELQKLHHCDQPLTGQSENGVQGTFLSQDPTIKSLLQLGIICLPGGRDRAGRAVVEVYGGRNGWISPQVSPLELCRLLLYLHSIPRSEVRELGLTVVIDSRRCPLTSVFYKSLLMVQEQALHAVHTILMLVDKDANPRPEKHPGLQIDVVTSLKALHKTVDGHQLTSDLSGSFPYSHEDWLQFHQKLSLFQIDLQAASSLLQTAIRRLDVKKTDTAKDVQSCIQEQRSSMKMVLEDTRLVALQREGGAILARMRREESRFAQSEDFRDSLESVTCLYNQVEESVHMLVMKSNQSLQHLEHVLLLRETQDSLHTIQKWCDAEERLWQKDKDDAEKTLQKIQQRLQDTQTILRQAKENKERGMLLIKDVERKSKGTHYPETDAFGCYTTGFKTRMTGFLLKAEERKSELQTSVDLYRFCEEASSLVKECMEYLDHMKSSNSPMRACWSSLQAFEERFQHFSPKHFQDRSAALLERLPDGIWMWNAVQTQCRDIRQRLSEILQASHTHKDSRDEARLNLVSGQTQNRSAGQADNETLTYLQSEGSEFEPVMTSSMREESASHIQQSVQCTNQKTSHLHEPKDMLHNPSMQNESASHIQQSVQCTNQKTSHLHETEDMLHNASMHKKNASHIQQSVQCTKHLHEYKDNVHNPLDVQKESTPHFKGSVQCTELNASHLNETKDILHHPLNVHEESASHSKESVQCTNPKTSHLHETKDILHNASMHKKYASHFQPSIQCTDQKTSHLHEPKDKLHNAPSMHEESASHIQQSVQCKDQKTNHSHETNNILHNPSMQKESASHIQQSVQCTNQKTSHLPEPKDKLHNAPSMQNESASHVQQSVQCKDQKTNHSHETNNILHNASLKNESASHIQQSVQCTNQKTSHLPETKNMLHNPSMQNESASHIQQFVQCTNQKTSHLHEPKDIIHNASMHKKNASHVQQYVQCTNQKTSHLHEPEDKLHNAPSMHEESASHIQQSVQCTNQKTSHLHEPEAKSHNPSDTRLKKHHHKNSHSDGDLSKSGQIRKFDHTAHYKVFIRSQSAESCLRGYCYNIPVCKTDTETSTASCVGTSWEGLSPELNQHDSFCSSASGFSQCDVNEKFSSDCRSSNGSGSVSGCSDNAFKKQEETICRPDCTMENCSTALKLQRIMQELLQTEQEYVRALTYVVENYMPELERPDVPQDLRGQRGLIFGNLEKLRDFHQHHFIQELELCLEEPFSVGRCFLKHKESFGLYALYSKNKPRSENLLIQHGKDFFKQKQQQLKDALDLSSYLLKPVQRISKYSLLLQDLLRECECVTNAELQRTEIHTALNIIQFQLRHGNNLLAMDDIHGCDVNLKEQGQLIRQDEFLLTFRKKKCYRHIFLFQDLILFSKTRKTDVGNDTYVYKQSFKTSDIGMTHNSGDSGLCFEIWFRRRKTQDTYVLQAASREVKESWTRDLERILWEQAIHNREIRMQERVFMGIGHKPFMDIKPSEMAISDRAINCVLTGRGGVSVFRLNSIGSASGTSSSGSQSSCSSGWGSLSPVVPVGGDDVRYVQGTSGILEEDDLDQESGNHSTLVASSESSGESVSCFSTSAHSCSSVIGGDCEHSLSELRRQHKQDHLKTTNQTRGQTCANVQSPIGKSTEV
ncbi:quattro isoform X2 [Danio aesculapii]|uniref:quattro isoform X2 n=1 Tax=Danio aesculapii TaxID=1142201 RepID=UPI0024BF21D4|nr:quattro isoform X2 [Danio aesculapii]